MQLKDRSENGAELTIPAQNQCWGLRTEQPITFLLWGVTQGNFLPTVFSCSPRALSVAPMSPQCIILHLRALG